MPAHTACCLVSSELALFDALETIVRSHDPDVLVGFEVQVCLRLVAEVCLRLVADVLVGFEVQVCLRLVA